MRHAYLAALVLSLGLGGCNKEPAGALPMPVVPQTSAEHAARAVLDALQDGNPAGFWAGMPDRWQKDVNVLVRDFGYKMDPALYDESAELLGRLIAVMRDKKQFFLASPMMQGGMQSAALQQNWDSVMDFMDVLLQSQLGTAKGLRGFDGGLFLRAAGPRFVDSFRDLADSQGFDLMARLAGVKVEPVKQDGAAQVLRFTSPGEDSEEMRFIMVDGRWVPEVMAQQWDSQMSKAKRALEEMPDTSNPQTKMQIKMVLGMFRGVLERLEEVDTQEKFNRAFQGMNGMMSRPPK